MPRETPTNQDLIRRLIDGAPAEASAPDQATAAAHFTSEHLYREISRWVGPAGSQGLFARALRTTRVAHPVLEGINLDPTNEPHLEGVAEAVRGAGDAATAKGLEAMLHVLLDLLGRFVGSDLVATLVEQSTPGKTRNEFRPEGGGDRHGNG